MLTPFPEIAEQWGNTMHKLLSQSLLTNVSASAFIRKLTWHGNGS